MGCRLVPKVGKQYKKSAIYRIVNDTSKKILTSALLLAISKIHLIWIIS